jgi:hypothetical protein
MQKDIVEGNLGSVGKYDVEFREGKLVAKADAAAGPVDAKVELSIDAGKVVDAIAAKIPGKLDDALLAMLKEAILK